MTSIPLNPKKLYMWESKDSVRKKLSVLSILAWTLPNLLNRWGSRMI